MEHPEHGMDSRMFENGNDIRPWFKENPEWVKVDQLPIRLRRPVEHALGPMKRSIVGILKEVRERFGLRKKDITFQVYLTGKGNFRECVAKERVYKGNRDRTMRPLWYEECRIYLRERWAAEVVEGYEADDAISIEARALWEQRVPHVVATVDKDLDQIPGPHFDYGKKVWYHMDTEDSMMFFYEQILSGDATDNIAGVYRLGKTKAPTIIKDAAADWYGFSKPEMSLEEYLWEEVVIQYRKNMERYPDKYVGTDPEAVAIENARLVKMQEYVGQLWTPPGKPDEVIDND
jgi:hypothetical protein